MSTDETSLVMIEITDAMQMRIAGFTKSGESIDVKLRLTRIESQRIANCLLDFAVPEYAGRRKAHKETFLARYDPALKLSSVVRLTDADQRRGAARTRLLGGGR